MNVGVMSAVPQIALFAKCAAGAIFSNPVISSARGTEKAFSFFLFFCGFE
jgi:hypothetical protein